MGVPRFNGMKYIDTTSTEAFITRDTGHAKPHQHRTGFCVIVFLLILIGIGICVMILYKTVVRVDDVRQDLPKFCMECSELSFVNQIEKDNVEIRREENKLKCCAKTSEQYTLLMKMIQAKLQLNRLLASSPNKETEDVTFSLLHKAPVAAHMLIGADLSDHQNNTRKNDVENLPPVHNLLPTRSLSLLSGVKLHHDRLIVQTKGIYLVYSQIYFKLIEDVNWPDGLKIISHIVDRYNDNLPNDGEEKLLQSVHTLTQISTQRRSNIDFHSSYISGVFELDVGDEIYTRVTSRQIISRDPTLNYIGLVMLSDPLQGN
ncbi:tumor necrosis factor ligand superfamily member 10-like [Patella vulgata]|uniref:tumor necrosis factor ligand superfamily member 10-like n=1 Tax=Patella vulgata TaxID=6465 RepID=UPI00217F368D|nr:tumor necrosis factor ligand superfamily member 10-like [Patella vulgata]XP_050418944.1 tumor necrosis factor ligand superfamily member 10-like [Patella vulgata]XP_050418952.1 tumor necrosis factor ligand superfamily member 10-like [Patella vulgata]